MSKKSMKKKILDEKIKEKLGIDLNKEITKSQYLLIIKKIKQVSEIKVKIPTMSNSKEDIINWLIDHIATIITSIPEL